MATLNAKRMFHREPNPKVGRQSKIIAILNPGKDSAIAKIYIPISLQCMLLV